MKVKSLHINKYKVLENFDINFTNEGKTNPVTVICGINGSGKTTLLDFINRIFTKGENAFEKRYIYGEDIVDVDEIKTPWSDEEGKYSTTPAFLKHIATEYASKVIYYEADKELYDIDDAIVNYVDKLIYEDDTKSSEAYEKTRNKIKNILECLDLEIEFDSLNKDKNVFFRNKNHNNLKIYDLSGGEREIITKLLPLYLSDIKDSIILIDEPETSLHPNWQSRIVELYEKVAIKNNLQIIITTHSPYIVGGIKKECLKILTKENGIIKVIDNNTYSYGKRIDEILLEIFGVKGLRTPKVEEKIEHLQKMLLDNKQNKSEFKTLLTEMENILGRNDRDLTLIRLELARLSHN
ncbi:MAG: AAA family ATPase [Bacteroidales bacterium]|nr:AAA family ATPase [Bacteroidales bacterium]